MMQPGYYKSILLIILLLLSNVAYSQQGATYRQQIEQIGEKISALGRTLSNKQSQRSKEQNKLYKINKEIKNLQTKIKQSEKTIRQQQLKINKIRQQIENHRADKQQQTEQLSTLINSAHRISKTNYIKLLLNQENPYAVGRLNSYYQYFSQAQNEKITDIKIQLAGLGDLQQTQQQEQNKLNQNKQQLVKQQQQLQKTNHKKKKLLASLDNSINKTNSQINKLEEDRSRLNNLLGSFSKQITKTQRYIVSEGSFKQQKGRLALPVNGLLKQKFGVYITDNGLRSDGVFLQTNSKQPVKSVYRGKVLFADWFKGYGLMLIVDHGNNYMSLYGHNNKLYKNIGDIVETNEVISQTGTTGGLKTAGLYFEIRSNGSPINPQQWCIN